ncbi:glycosyl transferase family 1 [Escherichia coli]|uniref:HVO_A0114 family putative DNA-binding protein n=1 Tax=Escherichia coli TaxID=562 RepID=UPI000B7CCB27|nr:glycosyl transferase family 1 [Escherichia coli]EER5391525.1 glycosyl transferase family 1 [Escherichia coli]EER6665589.1 glycosyl transferase family 1 [Escherichia coli]EEU2031821.1 glycosyl transferase family 1 [Escherichia coli]EEW5073679.1 glycosyl transferase family 1 [Escherichia coli]EGK3959280.1 glycosyl transferase family 1 [Escherichia coli]
MKTVTIRIESLDAFTADVLSAFKKASEGATSNNENIVSFPDWQMMHKVLTPKRMDILMAMTGAGELSIREIAGLVGRDVKAVHTDVTSLINNGLLAKGERGTLFPYDDIHFDFTLGKAA